MDFSSAFFRPILIHITSREMKSCKWWEWKWKHFTFRSMLEFVNNFSSHHHHHRLCCMEYIYGYFPRREMVRKKNQRKSLVLLVVVPILPFPIRPIDMFPHHSLSFPSSAWVSMAIAYTRSDFFSVEQQKKPKKKREILASGYWNINIFYLISRFSFHPTFARAEYGSMPPCSSLFPSCRYLYDDDDDVDIAMYMVNLPIRNTYYRMHEIWSRSRQVRRGLKRYLLRIQIGWPTQRGADGDRGEKN